MYTDDVLVVAFEPTYILDILKETYTIKAFGFSKVHLVCEYAQVKTGATNWLVVASTTYITEYIRKDCALLKANTLRKD